MFDHQAHYQRTRWYVHDRFGMFIHWGLYAIPARGEWVRSQEEMPVEEYEPFFHEFNPVDYDPKQWARAAKEAGMKYAVLTAKHHDGFCLFDSALTDYKATNTPAGRDLVREFVEAFRAEGLKVGLYYSLLDWHHPDYPHFGDRHHPMRRNEAFRDHAKQEDFSRYIEYFHGQVRELCTNYGHIDLMWFDFSYDDMKGEKWEASRLVHMIRELQPHMIIDSRLEAAGGAYGSLITGNTTDYTGDFVCPEQIVPPQGIRDVHGDPVIWETCMTMNNNWGYCSKDHYFKPADMMIKKLVECVSKGGNLLLNVGPDAKGNIPDESLEILQKIGKWMYRNSESIYGCGPASIEKPEYGRITQKGDHLYYHVMEPMVGYIPLTGLPVERIESVRLLRDGSELPIVHDWITDNYETLPYVTLGPDPCLPDPIDTVLDVKLRG